MSASRSASCLRLLEPAGVLDCWPGAPGELLEQRDLVLLGVALGRAPEHPQRPERVVRLVPGAARRRCRGSDRRAGDACADTGSVRRSPRASRPQSGETRPGSPPPRRRRGRRVATQRRRRARARSTTTMAASTPSSCSRRLERSREHLVEVDRRRDLGELFRARRLVAGPGRARSRGRRSSPRRESMTRAASSRASCDSRRRRTRTTTDEDEERRSDRGPRRQRCRKSSSSRLSAERDIPGRSVQAAF